MGGVSALLSARGLAVGHSGQALLRGVTFDLAAGEVLCLLGPNGVGKTTLFRTLLGLIPALGGALDVAGEPLARLSRAGVARRLAYVPQALSTPFPYSAHDLVLMGAAAGLGPFDRPGRQEAARAGEALALLGIADLAGSDVTRLSGGQRQMVLIARAIAQGAQAVVMDEPTASLDFANRIRVRQAVRDLARAGRGVILSTHDPDQAADLGDRALLVGPGGPLAIGPVGEVLSAANLTRLYGVAVRREETAEGTPVFRPGPQP